MRLQPPIPSHPTPFHFSIGPRVGDMAPDFDALTTEGPIQFHKWLGRDWGLLFSHPEDFTPVCTTELGALAKLLPAFRERDVKVIGLSVDTAQSHLRWLKDIEAIQRVSVDFPIIADVTRVISHIYGMIHAEEDDRHTVRTAFLIDPRKTVRMSYAYPQTTGRNFKEVLRVLDSLQDTRPRLLA